MVWKFIPIDWWQVIFNPSLPYRFVHMVLAAYLTTALVVGGVGAFHLLRNEPNLFALHGDNFGIDHHAERFFIFREFVDNHPLRDAHLRSSQANTPRLVQFALRLQF